MGPLNPIILAGLLNIGIGIFAWAISGVLSRIASGSYAYLRPGQDKEAFRRRNAVLIRIIAILFVVLGIGIVVYGLLRGR